ncbi:hypothetical protein [Candidatus Spongiihabitans sp.]|uniref:hypothetical protein n=1 Tax=Candidatus Spongiihabitans sp. TaxID=3101308 RepID=UPI003C7A2965
MSLYNSRRQEGVTLRVTALIVPQPVIARLVPGNPVIKPFGAAELLILAASPKCHKKKEYTM